MTMISYCSLVAINSSSPILSVGVLALASMHLRFFSACTIILSAPSILRLLGLVFRSFLVLSVITMGVSLLVKCTLAPILPPYPLVSSSIQFVICFSALSPIHTVFHLPDITH
ncbi:hypothetical protein FKM82_022440 [Ascaphus truei]